MMRNARFAVLAFSICLAGCSGGDQGSPADTAAPAPAEGADVAMGAAADAAAAVADMADDAATGAAVLAALAGDHRGDGAAARDVYRHPLETLTFFGIEPDHTVIEVWPGGASAWYTEVLAPTLRDGRLIAAGYSKSAPGFFGRAAAGFEEKVLGAPDVYGNVEIIDYQDPAAADLGEPGVADAVLLFRLYHNAIRNEVEDDILADAFAALKPGGVLGVVQHRSPEDAPDETERRDGYVKESKVIADAEAAGFEFVEGSEINANPQDSHEHPEGVWTLPPSLALCDADAGDAAYTACRAQWQAIGESDRMTLKFVKPAA